MPLDWTYLRKGKNHTSSRQGSEVSCYVSTPFLPADSLEDQESLTWVQGPISHKKTQSFRPSQEGAAPQTGNEIHIVSASWLHSFSGSIWTFKRAAVRASGPRPGLLWWYWPHRGSPSLGGGRPCALMIESYLINEIMWSHVTLSVYFSLVIHNLP